MSKKTKVEINLLGINAMMKSAEIQSAVDAAGAAVAQMAGSDYASSTHLASYVAICNVWPDTKQAAIENNRDNTLVKAVDAVGLPKTKPRL